MYEKHVVPINKRVVVLYSTFSFQGVSSGRVYTGLHLSPTRMAGPNLEVFKFAVYVFFPVLVFLHYGDPEWYRTNVIPVRTSIPSTVLVS